MHSNHKCSTTSQVSVTVELSTAKIIIKLERINFSNIYTESVTLGKENYLRLCSALIPKQLFADTVTFAATQLISHETGRVTSKAFLKIMLNKTLQPA